VPTYLSPGVYIEEVEPGDPLYLRSQVLPEGRTDEPRPLKRWSAEQGVAGFVGIAAQGEPHTPIAVNNWKEFQQRFGEPVEGTYLWYAVRGFFVNGGRRCYVVRINEGGVWNPRPEDFVGDEEARTGLAGLVPFDEIAVVAAPDVLACFDDEVFVREEVKATQLALIAHGEMLSRVVIIDPPKGLSARGMSEWRREIAGYDSRFAVTYYPWIKVLGWDGLATPVPPSGHLAGVYARTDLDRNTINEPIEGVLGMELDLTLDEQQRLHPFGINALLAQPGRGPLVWGARTLSSDPTWRYLRTRRLMNFISRNIRAGTTWVLAENSRDERLWRRIREDIEDLLSTLWRTGVLHGDEPAEAFLVKCDRETNPPEVVDSNTIIADCAVALHESGGLLDFRVVYYLG
jgi:uncharacterized protein